uniref:Secreted protein n=1 Tax=Plectus sambesii TaxID=2011161 RepID=A0A914UNM7_9BILA
MWIKISLICAIVSILNAQSPTSSSSSNSGTTSEIRTILIPTLVGTGGTLSRTVTSGSNPVISVGGGPDSVQTSHVQVISGVPLPSGTFQLVPANAAGDAPFTIQIVNANGQPSSSANGVLVPSGSLSAVGQTRQLNDGTVVRDCFDASSGMHTHGEQFVRGSSFKYKCNNGTAEVIACIATQRANFAAIEIGKSLDVNGFWHKCEYFETNQSVRYTQEASCFANGKEWHEGETFRSNAFKMRCETWGYAIAGCYYFDSNGEQKELEVGGSAEVGNLRHNCEKDPTVKGRVKYYVQAMGCVKNGKNYKANEEWTENHLRYKCNENGAFEVQGCILDSGKLLPIGGSFAFNHTAHRCYRIGITTYYHEFSCDYPGLPSCASADQPQAAEAVGSGLPPGWRVIDANGRPVGAASAVVSDQSATTLLRGNGQPIDGLIAVGEIIAPKTNDG